MHTAGINYYRVLGVSETATTSDIKKRYRLLSKQFHPDTVGGDEKIMAQINEAYSVLSDPLKRHYYEPPKPKVHKQPQPAATKPTYSQPPPTSYSKPRYETTAAPKNYATQSNENTWNRAFTYGFTLFFIIILAAFALPAANKFLVAYEANAANANTTQDTDTAPNTSPSYSTNTPSQNASLDTDGYSYSGENFSTPALTDTAEPTETPSPSANSSNTAPTPMPSPTPTPQNTSNQQAYNKWFNRHSYRYNN